MNPTTTTSWTAIVLAAGQGTRMKSERPKVLHPVAGRPMLTYAMDAALLAGAREVVVVVGHAAEAVEQLLRSRYRDRGVQTVLQPEQRGTGDAVRCAMQALPDVQGYVGILYGDVPLVPKEALTNLILLATDSHAPLAMITGTLTNPTGYGRILRNPEGMITAVAEHRDCSESELQIREVNPGIYAIEAQFLRHSLTKLNSHNAQGELYLTDVVREAARSGGVVSMDWTMTDLTGVNDRYELAVAEQAMQQRIARQACQRGITVRDPQSVSLDADVVLHPEVTLERNVVLRGETVVHRGARIDVGCVLTDVVVEEDAYVQPYTVATDSRIGRQSRVGPFAHLRPGTDLGEQVHVGNFVETKKTRMARGAKANHLSYLGDGDIGERANIGAGTIFCNYDGFHKHTTVIGHDAFIGSDSQLVAPVVVGERAYVATGTTVTSDVPPDALAIGRVRQENRPEYAARLREKKRSK
jgi:bifunctional UDP-N-acetylglucosamine pyrophosphorylase/glucosamine-1-phosphate N-acetyltransferase